ncbi:Uu.00g125660.m01.CDS01 [Anthostomella pinea]|uniref:Uu.00g125660.m01.CDS01 n=1 Tax=Anthostomella pinea TaxID=933095 RepID=A0AAI8VHU7_9PEZI|nr:Uu.00g125660.m01.CDS01 [Anthostomella pinea]
MPIVKLTGRRGVPADPAHHFYNRFKLPQDDGQHHLDPAWFDRQKQRHVEKDDPSLRRWLVDEVNILKAFHDGDTDAEETAHDITRPISTSSVPDLGGYSDGILASNGLWFVLITALIEWPCERIADLLALLDAIARIPDKIHKGEVIGDEHGDALSWSGFPYFALSWPDDLQPGQICRQCPDAAARALARRLYLKIRDIEAQLVARHVMGMSRQMIRTVICALETDKKDVDGSDDAQQVVAPNEAVAYDQVVLDFHIPAVAFLFQYNVREVYDLVVVRDGLRDWTRRSMPDGARRFEDGATRWVFWERRLGELAGGSADEEVRGAAEAALGSMALGEGVWRDEAR